MSFGELCRELRNYLESPSHFMTPSHRAVLTRSCLTLLNSRILGGGRNRRAERNVFGDGPLPKRWIAYSRGLQKSS